MIHNAKNSPRNDIEQRIVEITETWNALQKTRIVIIPFRIGDYEDEIIATLTRFGYGTEVSYQWKNKDSKRFDLLFEYWGTFGAQIPIEIERDVEDFKAKMSKWISRHLQIVDEIGFLPAFVEDVEWVPDEWQETYKYLFGKETYLWHDALGNAVFLEV